MTASKPAPVLIIGQGLAGTLLAWQLIRLGQSVQIVDREERLTSSKVAGGIVTPITGMRMVKTWRLDDFFPAALELYRWIENKTSSSLFFEKPIQRLFKNKQEQDEFNHRMSEPGFADYVLQTSLADPSQLKASFGGFVMKGGYLDVSQFLQASRRIFTERGYYQSGDLKNKDLELVPNGWHWRQDQQKQTYQQIVFCQGWSKKSNPLFDWVPFKPAKGEVLEIRCPDLSEKHIINRSGFIAPLGNGKFRSGSTYEWQQLDNRSTDAGRQKISAKIRAMTDLPFEITDHQAAVRPIIENSKALLGCHPDKSKKGLAFFNGLGSKGVLNGPFLSAMLANHLVHGHPIEESVDLQKNF